MQDNNQSTSVQYRISPDKMSVLMTIADGPGEGKQLCLEDIIGGLQKSGIRFGLDLEAIKDFNRSLQQVRNRHSQ